MLGSTVVTLSASAPGWLFEEFQVFLPDGVDSAPEVDSRLLFSEVAAHIVDNSSGMYCTGFAGIDAPPAVFPTIALSWHGEVCTVDASAAGQFFLVNLDNISMSLLYLADFFSSLDVARVDFLGALDDEEFFVVEGSGGGGVAGSLDSQVTCHQLVSVTVVASPCRCGHSHRTSKHPSETTSTNNKQQTTNNKQQTTNIKQQTANSQQPTANKPTNQQTNKPTSPQAHNPTSQHANKPTSQQQPTNNTPQPFGLKAWQLVARLEPMAIISSSSARTASFGRSLVDVPTPCRRRFACPYFRRRCCFFGHSPGEVAAESEVGRDHPVPCRDVAATALNELTKEVQRLERVLEQIGGVSVPQLTESLVDDPQRAPQEHVRNCVVEQIKSVLVPQIWEPVVDLQLVPQERVQNRLGEDFMDVPVPLIKDEIVDSVQVSPQERVQNLARELFVDVPMPQIKEDGLQLVPQERVQNRAKFTGKVFTVKMRHHRDEQAYAAETLGFIKGSRTRILVLVVKALSQDRAQLRLIMVSSPNSIVLGKPWKPVSFLSCFVSLVGSEAVSGAE